MKNQVSHKLTLLIPLPFLLALVLLILSWCSPGYADLYREAAFPYVSAPLRFLTGLCPISVGELLIIAGLILLFLVPVFLITGAVLKKKGKSGRPVLYFFRFFFTVLSCISLIMVLNCFTFYHCTRFDRLYFPKEVQGKQYSFAQLTALRNALVEKVNTLSRGFERNEEGEVLYAPGLKAMKEETVRAVSGLSETYPLLGGAYNRPKELLFSVFMSQQRMQGYYFPFSMEANINADMTMLRKPSTMCHELAHTKGFLYEDEANFIGFLACISSEDPYFQYSGYCSVLYYVDNDFYRGLGSREAYETYPAIAPQVLADNRFLTEAAERRLKEAAVLPSELVEKAADTFVDANLAANGIPEGSLTYAKVVDLLLEYYDSEGFF